MTERTSSMTAVVPQDSWQGSDALPTKVCPQCGQVLFEDMDVCYGCLHDFTHEVDVRSLGLPVTLLEDEQVCPEEEATDAPASGAEHLRDDAACRLRVPGQGIWRIRVESKDVSLTVPLPATGLMVGRLPTNDIVLHSRSVSRHHVLIVPMSRGVQVIDQGATNSAVLKGREVTSSMEMRDGETLEVCGVQLTLECEGGASRKVS